MPLSQDLKSLIQCLLQRTVIDRHNVIELMREVNFDERLIEDIIEDEFNLQDVIDEMVNQTLIWVDDETGRGDITYLKRLIKTTENYNEILPRWDNLSQSLKNDNLRPRPKLPEGLILMLTENFQNGTYDWNECRVFLACLNLEEGTLNAIEANENDVSLKLKEGLTIFQIDAQNDTSTDRDLIVTVIQALENATIKRLARDIKVTFL